MGARKEYPILSASQFSDSMWKKGYTMPLYLHTIIMKL